MIQDRSENFFNSFCCLNKITAILISSLLIFTCSPGFVVHIFSLNFEVLNNNMNGEINQAMVDAMRLAKLGNADDLLSSSAINLAALYKMIKTAV